VNKREREIRRILVGVWQRTISDEQAVQQLTAIKAEITAQFKKKFLEIVHNVRIRDMNVTQAEKELCR